MTFSAQPMLWSALIMRNIGGQKVISLDFRPNYSMVCLEKSKIRIFAVSASKTFRAQLWGVGLRFREFGHRFAIEYCCVL